MPEYRLRLAEGLRAPAQARTWLGERLARDPLPMADDALLLVSELVTNAVRHGAPEIVVAVSISERAVRIEVYDAGERLPEVPATKPSIDRPSGRGLLIVAATAHDWGVDQVSGAPGKTVWAELHRTASA